MSDTHLLETIAPGVNQLLHLYGMYVGGTLLPEQFRRQATPIVRTLRQLLDAAGYTVSPTGDLTRPDA